MGRQNKLPSELHICLCGNKCSCEEREREIKEQFLPVHFYLFNFSSNLSSLLIFSDIHMRTGPLENFFILAFTTIGKTIHVLHTWALEMKGLWRNSFHMDKSRPNMLLQTADQSRVQSPEAALVWKGISTERNLLGRLYNNQLQTYLSLCMRTMEFPLSIQVSLRPCGALNFTSNWHSVESWLKL